MRAFENTIDPNDKNASFGEAMEAMQEETVGVLRRAATHSVKCVKHS